MNITMKVRLLVKHIGLTSTYTHRRNISVFQWKYLTNLRFGILLTVKTNVVCCEKLRLML